MGLDFVLFVLGIPSGWLTNLTTEKVGTFFANIETHPLQSLFIKAFYTVLDSQAKKYGDIVKKLKKAIKKDQDRFLELFHCDAKEYDMLMKASKLKDFQDNTAAKIVHHFGVEDNFIEVMELIVADGIKNYQEAFLETMTLKQGIQLLVLLYGQNKEQMIEVLSQYNEKLVSEFKKIVSQSTQEDKPVIALKPGKVPKNQIKILSIMASPEDIEGIDYEKEQDSMLDAFRDFEREEVFLDMPDPFKSTLTEIEDHLKDGKHDILHITAHGGISTEGDGYLCLEDHKGKNHEVSGQLLMNSLVPPPRIVILSACHSARKEPELMPVAQAIFAGGINIVIGMDKAISHDAEVEFNTAFFKSLCRDETVSQAFEHGKAAIMTGEQQRLRDIPGWKYLKEYDIPHLLVREKDAQLTREGFSAHIIAAPGRPQSHHFFGARYLERGFIGRRQVLRDIHGRIEDQKGAVVLKGPGGIGKSTLTTRMAANLKGKSYDFIVIQGETSPEQILDAISKKAVYNGLKDAESIYAASVDVKKKLNWYLNHFLLKGKFLIIFDNFEENQREETGDFGSMRLKEFLVFFKEALKGKETFLFFSTRYWLPGFDEPGMILEISELKANEFHKLLQNTAALKRLDLQSIRKLSQEVGGNPRGLELLDKIAFEEFNLREFTWEQLKALLPELQRRIIEKTGPGDDFTPLYLERLFTYLSESQRNLLDILSIYRNPVPKAAIEAQKASMTKQDRQKLSGLSLLECRETNKERLYYIHRLTAQYMLGKMEKAAALKYHLKAATYFKNLKNEKGKYDLYDLIEAR